MVTLQIFKSLRFGELSVNGNSPIFSVVKLWRVSRILCIQNVFISLQHVLLFYFFSVCWFCVDLILYLSISYL